MGSEQAETFLRVLAERHLRQAVASPRPRWLDPDYRLGGSPPAEDGLLRVQAAALGDGRPHTCGSGTIASVTAGGPP